MPPLACNVIEYAVPTVPVRLVLVEVTAGAAGTVIVAVPVLLVSATEVAVIVADCDELVAAGAVYVAPVVDVFDSVPPPLTLQVTPPEFLSFVTVALTVVVSVPSTVLADAVTAMLKGWEEPPQPDKPAATIAAKNATATNEQIDLR
jgi:hypothetical protein